MLSGEIPAQGQYHVAVHSGQEPLLFATHCYNVTVGSIPRLYKISPDKAFRSTGAATHVALRMSIGRI